MKERGRTTALDARHAAAASSSGGAAFARGLLTHGCCECCTTAGWLAGWLLSIAPLAAHAASAAAAPPCSAAGCRS